MEECKAYKRIKKITCLTFLIGAIFCCFCWFSKWSEIPNQTIKANLIAFDDISDSSCCNFEIYINAGSSHDVRKDKNSTNRMIVWHRSKNSVRYNSDINLLQILKDDSTKYRDKLSNMHSFYVLDYHCSTTINAKSLYSDSHHQYDSLCFSYIDNPQPYSDSEGISYSGSGFVAFIKSSSKDEELCGKGELSFNTNLINNKPEMKSFWDITQANYNISITCENISCDTITIEFYGATLFSNIYPEPDKTTMSGIEFTSPDKIKEIIDNGLLFHVEFIELREMSAKRTFILTAIMSLLISIIANIIFQGIYGKK